VTSFSLSEASKARLRVAQFRAFALHAWVRLRVLNLGQTAASLTFLSLLAFVPIVALTLLVLSALPGLAKWREALQSFMSQNLFLPTFSATVIEYAQQFANQAERLSIASTLVFFASAFLSLYTIEQTLNQIWQCNPHRAWLRRASLYWTLLTLGPLLLGASLALESYLWSFASGGELHAAHRAWTSALPWLLVFVALVLLYRLLPATRVRWRHAVFGALIAASAAEVIKRSLASYLLHFPTYTVVYGAFAALPVFLIWLYALWTAVLGGALLAAEARFLGRIGHPGVDTPAGRFSRASTALAAILAANDEGRPWVLARAMRGTFDNDPRFAEDAAHLLESNGYIRRMAPPHFDSEQPDIWEECWVMAHAAQEQTRAALFRAVWSDVNAPAPQEWSQPLRG
jgi:membrane protein